METRANYALIGLFTLAVILGIFGFIYWFKTFGQQTVRNQYTVHFDGSVSGLLNGANVMFNGLKIGEVTELGLVPTNPNEVYARISVDANAPIRTDTTAALEFGGLTGVASVALQGGSPTAERLPPNGVLNAHPSQLQSLIQKGQALAGKADEVLNNVNAILKDNGPALKTSIANIQDITTSLADKNGNFLQALNSVEPGKVRSIMTNADQAMAKINNLLADGSGKTMIADITEAARSIRKLADSLSKFANTGLRQYEGLAIDGRKTLQDVDHAVKTIEKNPQSIIFGPKPALPDYGGR
jgi:phospholipid/cholesterol/gamma-HCH transport system substrate-binding protein